MKKNILLLSFLSTSILVNAQESVNAAGGDASGSGGTAAYSVGQVVYTTATGANGSSEQGVQHAYEIFTLDKNESAYQISLSAFPNPTSDKLNLSVSDFKSEKLHYELFDMKGKLIVSGRITSNQTSIDMTSLPTAEYLVKLMEGNKKIQTFKILKIS